MLRSTPRVKIDTPNLLGSINLKGARIDDLRLLRHRESIDPRSAPVRLFSPAGAPGAYFVGLGWTADGIAVMRSPNTSAPSVTIGTQTTS